MKKVHHCESCGFISTIANEYTFINGVRVCVGCKRDYDQGDENVTRWVNEKQGIKEIER